jgi:hypothetical protein
LLVILNLVIRLPLHGISRSLLLQRVREFMGEQATPDLSLRLVLVMREGDVWPERVS